MPVTVDTIEHELRRILFNKMQAIAPVVTQRAREILRREIENCSTIQSLKRGILRGEFGIEDTANIDEIIEEWLRGLTVRVVVSRGKLSLVLTAIPDHYLNVIGLSAASQPIKNGGLDWLRLLLLAGTATVVYDHYPSRANAYEAKYSRSNTNTIMRQRKGAEWSVPSEYAGAIDDNFISRLGQQLNETMALLMMEELTR